MKIRNGFVSNSSSSSFLIVFKKKPKTVEELQKILFESKTEVYHPYRSVDEPYGIVPTNQIACTVFGDLQKEAKLKDIIEFFSCCHEAYEAVEKEIGSSPTWDEKDKKSRSKAQAHWRKQSKAIKAWSIKRAKSFINDNPGKYFIVSYGDGDGDYFCLLEHGDIFRNIKHYRRSDH